MRNIDKESVGGKLLRAVGIGVGVAIVLSNKRSAYKFTNTLLKEIFSSKKDVRLNREIYRLRRQKLVAIKKDKEKTTLVLTEMGQKVILRFNYENLKLKKKYIWDTKWRMVLFDIPHKKKRARDALSFKLKQIGFVRFNNSVWVYPFPCQKEIDFIANYWGIGKYVHFAVVSDITNSEILKKHFNL